MSVRDVAAFRSLHGLPPREVDVLGGEGAGSDDPATTVLLEWAGALAPGANLTALVGDPWTGLMTAILDEVAPPAAE